MIKQSILNQLDWVYTKIEIDTCPFYNHKLPDLEESNIKDIAEGYEEYYTTCNKRHISCECYPPEYK